MTARSLRSKAAALLVAALAASLLVSTAQTAKAALSVTNGDDRVKVTPTSWWSYGNQTPSAVSSLLSTNGARLTDLSIASTNPLRFNVAMVRNTGSYAIGWHWYYGLTDAQVNSNLSANNARPIVIKRYFDPAVSAYRFAVVMVNNQGVNAKAWSWWYGTASFINSKVGTTNRPIQLDPYAADGYVAILHANNGADSTGFWYYYHVTGSQISTFLSNNNARLIDLSRNSDGTYNVIMYPRGSTTWFYYFNTPISTLTARATQLGQRIIDVTSYSNGSSTVYAALMTENLDSLSRRIANIYRGSVDSGKYGFYFRRVNSSTLAALQQGLPFEPASSLKVLYHMRNILSQEAGAATDSSSLTYRYNPAAPSNGGICPDNYTSTATTTLKTGDTVMMQNSDNRTTRAILEKYGKTAMLNLATSLGMTKTQINHNIGCPTATTHNFTSLLDLEKVYNSFASGARVTNATWRTQFTARMLNDDNFPNWRSGLCPVVQQEATKLGKSSATASSFCNAMQWYAKGGSYQYSGAFPTTVSYSGMGVTRLPVKSSPGGAVTGFRDFIFGDFTDNTNVSGSAEITAIGNARNAAEREALRGQINSALQTW